MLTVLVIDTSYLLELYRVPDYFDPAAHDSIKVRLDQAAKTPCRLFVPFPVIFEVANHIVDARDGDVRKRLADHFVGDVVQSFERTTPFSISPAINERTLHELLKVFAKELALQRVGLTDCAIVGEARRIKGKYGDHARVHIWTRDRRLKAHEPDPEPDPFL